MVVPRAGRGPQRQRPKKIPQEGKLASHKATLQEGTGRDEMLSADPYAARPRSFKGEKIDAGWLARHPKAAKVLKAIVAFLLLKWIFPSPKPKPEVKKEALSPQSEKFIEARSKLDATPLPMCNLLKGASPEERRLLKEEIKSTYSEKKETLAQLLPNERLAQLTEKKGTFLERLGQAKEDLEKKQAENKKALEENKRGQANKEKEITKEKEAATQAQSKMLEQTKDLQQLREKQAENEENRSTLQTRLTELEATLPPLEETVDAKSRPPPQLAALRQQKEAKFALLENPEIGEADKKGVRQTIKFLEEEIKRLEAQFQEEKASVAALSQELVVLKEEQDNKKAELKRVEDERDERAKEISILTDSIRTSQQATQISPQKEQELETLQKEGSQLIVQSDKIRENFRECASIENSVSSFATQRGDARDGAKEVVKAFVYERAALAYAEAGTDEDSATFVGKYLSENKDQLETDLKEDLEASGIRLSDLSHFVIQTALLSTS